MMAIMRVRLITIVRSVRERGGGSERGSGGVVGGG